MPETLNVSRRTEFGSRASRRLRRQGSVPAVIYGRGGDELNLTVDRKDFMDQIGYTRAISMLQLSIDGEEATAIVKDVQWDVITDQPVHIDFLRVSPDQTVTVPVPVRLMGKPEGVNLGGVLEQVLNEIEVSVRASAIPAKIEIDVTGLMLADSLHVADLDLAEGVTSETPLTSVVATVVAPTAVVEEEEEEEEEELAEGEELPEGEAPEGEEGKEAAEEEEKAEE
jgi:large subunit ribosomal protein L25